MACRAGRAMTLFDPGPGSPPEPTVRVRMVVAYDGSGFHGYGENPGVRTVAGVLRAAIERVRGHRVDLIGAGRTDRGVHAWGQVVSFATRADDFDPIGLQRSLNKLVGPAIAVRSVAPAEADFHARFSATGRVYRYRILNTAIHDPFQTRTTWHVPQPLDLAVLRLASHPLVGEHDFAAFCRRPAARPDGGEPSLRRTVRRAVWRTGADGVLEFEIAANAFCHQMVRSITGTLVDIGLGRHRASDMVAMLGSRDRSRAGRVAPPEGLTLWHVEYEQP